MIYLELLSLLFFCLILNRVRGSGDIPFHLGSKAMTSLLTALACYFILDLTLIELGIAFIGVLVWAFKGWGKYFCAIHGEYNQSEREFFLSDLFLDRLYPTSKGFHHNCNAGALGMAIRGIMIAPLVITMCVLNANYSNLYLIPTFMIAQGLSYTIFRFGGKGDLIAKSETIFGFFIGLHLYLLFT